MTTLELKLTELEQLQRTRHILIDRSTTIAHSLEQNQAAIESTLRTIKSLQQPPTTLTKYEKVVQYIEQNHNTLILQPRSPEDSHIYSQDELQAIAYHLDELTATIAPDPKLHL